MNAAPEPADSVLLGARLSAQLLSGPPAGTAVDATRHLLAIQGQDPRGLRLALRVRSATRHASEIDHALTRDRSLVVTWVNRGTLHLIAAEDEPLLHLLTTPQLRTGTDRRLSQTGVNPAAAQRGVDIIVAAITENGPMTRRELRDVLERRDIPVAGQALVHILFRATLDGHIIRGPVSGSEQAFVLVADWLGPRPKLDRDTALAHLARRYLVGHGPATDRDLAKWAGITLGDARAGLSAISPQLMTDAAGRLTLPGRDIHPLPPPRLLGPFDPVLLGWADRGFVYDLNLGDVVVTTNGIFKPTVLIRGRVGGTWTSPGGQPQLNVTIPHSSAERAALQADAADVERYLE